jgi:predicted phosphodiesterase
MTRIGIFTDIHANLYALEAVLAAFDREHCDIILHTGDAIGIGPQPAEVLSRLRERPDIRCLMGNHDELFVQGLPDRHLSGLRDAEYFHQHWNHAQLTADMRDMVAGWPYTFDINEHGVTVRFCHYAPPAGGSGFATQIVNPSAANLDELFGSGDADIVFYGHHHPMSDLQGRSRYVNPGAAGCSIDGLARYAILDIGADGNWTLDLRSESYDRTALIAEFERRKVYAREEILRGFYGHHLDHAQVM